MTFPHQFNKTGLALLLLSVAIVFVWMRPLQSPWNPIIGGDGLGYYSYLPATFIYDDQDYEFAWFNAAHDSNYVYSAFEDPRDNLLVNYGERKINKYYPGLSFLWMPFFAGGHLYATLTGVPADGFSAPYQLAIFLASLLNILLGIFFSYRLLRALTANAAMALLVAGSLFFGTYLFIYSIGGNSLSHAYSFTLLTAFLFFTHRFFNAEGDHFKDLLIAVLLLFIAVSVRPLSGLIIFVIPAFIPAGWRRPAFRFSIVSAGILLLLAVAVFYTFRIIFLQTGTLLPYTYQGESFDFTNPRFFAALFSYKLGLVVYAPLFLLSFIGVICAPRRLAVLTTFVFFVVVFLYSCWWYWPILVRALVDFYILPAIPLVWLLVRAHGRRRTIVVSLLIFCVAYFQLKSYQVRHGILVEFGTYGEMYWRNFFRIKPATMYPVPPSTIMHLQEHTENFENVPLAREGRAHSGQKAIVLDSLQPIATFAEFVFPDIYRHKGDQKIRVGFQTYFEGPLEDVHVFIVFRDSAQRMLREYPFYLNNEHVQRGSWDYKEFGTEIVPDDSLNADRVRSIAVAAWNVKGRGSAYIDDLKMEFIVADDDFETLKLKSE